MGTKPPQNESSAKTQKRVGRHGRVPKYRRHANGQAFVEHKSISTADHRMYLGKYGSDESHLRYRQFLKQLETGAPVAPGFHKNFTVMELADAWLDWAASYYVKDGKPTSELGTCVDAARFICRSHGSQLAAEFGPRAYIAVREAMIDHGYKRGVVNSHMRRLRRMFRWGVTQELVSPEVHQALAAVPGLRVGKSRAPESEKVRAATVDDVRAVLPYLSPVVQAMVQVQFLCGMRPGDVCAMRSHEIDTSGEIWLYRPEAHKMSHAGHSLVKAIPVVAQEVLRPWMREDEQWVFSPVDARRWQAEQRREASVVTRKQTVDWDSRPRTPYKADTYRQAVNYGFEAAEREGKSLNRFSPNQLRHAIAGYVSSRLGRQAAQLWLGHAHLSTTEIYDEKRVQDLQVIATQIKRNPFDLGRSPSV